MDPSLPITSHKGHECKATQRVSGPVRLRFGPCRSKKRYRPRFCGHCADRAFDSCCTPQMSTTIKVDFICDSLADVDSLDLEELLEPGRDLWWPDDLLALKIQNTTPLSPIREEIQLESSVSDVRSKYVDRSDDDFESFRRSIGWSSDSPDGSKSISNNVLDNYIASHESEQDVYHLDKPKLTTQFVNQIITTDKTTMMVTEETTTMKPKRRKKKKPRKPFTSWLEFRDEEYQMDEYEDYEDPAERPKRSVEKQVRRKRHNVKENEKNKVKRSTNKILDVQKEFSNINEESKLKTGSDFKIYRTIKSHMTKDPRKKLDKQAKRQWREYLQRGNKRRKIGNLQTEPEVLLNSNHLTKMERIMRERGRSGNLTRSWWRDIKNNRRKPSESSRKTRAAPEWLQVADLGYSEDHTVSLNVQWIVKCACNKACALATTTPSELSADGEIVLRRVHRTAPP